MPFILFDKTGIPVDYFEETYDVEIRAFLAKTIEFNAYPDWDRHRALRKERGENLEVRILNFEIVEE